MEDTTPTEVTPEPLSTATPRSRETHTPPYRRNCLQARRSHRGYRRAGGKLAFKPWWRDTPSQLSSPKLDAILDGQPYKAQTPAPYNQGPHGRIGQGQGGALHSIRAEATAAIAKTTKKAAQPPTKKA